MQTLRYFFLRPFPLPLITEFLRRQGGTEDDDDTDGPGKGPAHGHGPNRALYIDRHHGGPALFKQNTYTFSQGVEFTRGRTPTLGKPDQVFASLLTAALNGL